MIIHLEGYSGGAYGSDNQWEVIGRSVIKYPNTFKFTHYYHGKKTPFGTQHITEEDYHEGIIAMHKANLVLRRNVNPYISLLVRNYVPVKNADAIFGVVQAIPRYGPGVKHVNIDGGTGWGIQMAQDMGKPVYLFDQSVNQWKEYEEGWGWCMCTCPILTERFAGIGTRAIKENGIKAIEAIYHKTQLSWLARTK